MSLVILFLLYAIGYVAAFKLFKYLFIADNPKDYSNLTMVLNLIISTLSWLLVIEIFIVFIMHALHINSSGKIKNWLDKECTSKWL